MAEDKKSAKETYELFEAGKYDELSIEELRKLVELKKLGAFKQTKQATQDVEIPDIAKPSAGSGQNETNLSDFDWVIKSGTQSYKNMFSYTDADADCPTDYSNWTPTEFFSNFILQGVKADCPLADLVKMKVDVGAGHGDDVKFRHIDTRDAQQVNSCECMSCASNTMTTSNVQILRFGDYVELCEFELWQSKDVKRATLEAMRRGAARYVNQEIWDAINEAVGTKEVNLASTFSSCSASLSGSCCSEADAYNLYTAIIFAIAKLEKLGYNDIKQRGCLLLHPTVAAKLKYPTDLDVPYWIRGSTEVKDGELKSVGGLEVRECALCPDCSTATNAKLGVIIHKDRSLGMAWGKRPTFTYEYDGVCDSWEITYNAYMGVDSIEEASICWIMSPDS